MADFDAPNQATPAVATSHKVEPERADAATSAEVADYIADLLQELRDLSSASGHAQLSALLDLAQREARRNGPRTIDVNQTPLPPMTG